MKTSNSKYSKCIYFTSNALARKVEKLAIASWKQVDMSPSHGYLLMLLLEEPGMQPGNIAAQLQLTPSTITRLIEKLEARKLLVRTSEGKISNVYPTPKAKELLPQLKACVQDFSEAYSKVLGKEETVKLIQGMNKFSDKLSD